MDYYMNNIYKTDRIIITTTTEPAQETERFTYTFFLLLLQCIMNYIVASIAIKVSTKKKKTTVTDDNKPVPKKLYFQISFTYIGAMFASNYALFYVSYPAQVLGKSCKLIPVMLMQVLRYNKKYSLREYIAVLTITLGIVIFQFLSPKTKSTGVETSLFGLMLLFTSLTLDGFTGPTQDVIIKKYKPSKDYMMKNMNYYACILLIIALIISGEIFTAIQFVIRHIEILYEILLFCILSAAGQYCILYTLFKFDSLVLTTITTTRKFFTILISILYYGHSLSLNQWIGVFIVFFGLALDIKNKQLRKQGKLKQ